MTSLNDLRDQLQQWLEPARWPAPAREWVLTRLPPVVLVILLLVLADSLARITWNVVVPVFWQPDVPSAAESHRQAETVTPVAAAPNYASVVDAHLFGEAKVEPEAAPVTPAAAPETSLGLTLHGVFVYTGPTDGAAIIGRSGTSQRFIRTGEEVVASVTLVEVRADHVLLRRRGVFETLYFPKPQGKGVTFVAPSANATPVAESVATYTELFRQHPEKVFDYVRIEPVTSGGELQGYRLVAPEHPELHEQFGILPSDVIVAINGLKLNNQEAVTQALGQLASSNRIEVSLIRSGQSKTLRFQLD